MPSSHILYVMAILALILLAAPAFSEGLIKPVQLVEGSVFNRGFIQRERMAPETFVFDLDGTLGRMNPQGSAYIMRPGAVAQVDQLKAEGKRLALWTAQPRQGVEILARSEPTLLPKFDLVITGENFIPQAMDGFDDPEFAEAYKFAPKAKVEAFYLIGIAKDLSLFDGRRDGRGHAVIVDDHDDFAKVAPHAPFGPIAHHHIKAYTPGPEREPIDSLARSMKDLARLRRLRR